MDPVGFAVLPAHLARNGKIGLAAKGLLLALSSYADKAGRAWPSLATLAEDVGLGPRQVQRHLRRLEVDGWITIHQRRTPAGGQTSSLYALRFDRWGGAAAHPVIFDGVPLSDMTGGGDVEDTPPLSPVTPKQDQINRTKDQHGAKALALPLDDTRTKAKDRAGPPTLEEALAYVADSTRFEATPAEVEEAFDYLETVAWRTGKGEGKPIKDWQAGIRTSIRTQRRFAGGPSTGGAETRPATYLD